MKVICASEDCIHNNDRHQCTAQRINLAEINTHTVYDGYQKFNRCRSYEQRQEDKLAERVIEEFFRRRTDE